MTQACPDCTWWDDQGKAVYWPCRPCEVAHLAWMRRLGDMERWWQL